MWYNKENTSSNLVHGGEIGMKKLTKGLAVALVAALLGISAIGCSTTTSNTSSVVSAQPADKAFMTDMKKALQARWKLADADKGDEQVSADEEKKQLQNCVNAEWRVINKYENADFNDVRLGKIAKDYINAVNQQMDALKFYGVNDDKYSQEYTEAYNQRTQLVGELVKDYGLTVDPEYKQDLDDFQVNAQVVEESENTQEQIKKMISSIKFNKVDGENGSWPTYEVTLENTAGVTFEYFNLQISLLDKSGVIVESVTTNTIQNWKNGTKAKFSFSTDKEFEKMDITASYNQAQS